MGNIAKSVFVSFKTIGAALSPQSLTEWERKQEWTRRGSKLVQWRQQQQQQRKVVRAVLVVQRG